MKKRSSFVRNHVLRTFMIIFCLIISVKSEAGIVFDGSPGTNAPPGSLGGFPMIPFSPDTRPLDGLVNFVPVGGACPAEIRFDVDFHHVRIGQGWLTWSHGYTGDVYYTSTAVRAITLPAGTRAFYLYVEPKRFDVFNIQAIANDGTSSGIIPVSGTSGAKYFGFYTTNPSCLLTTIRVYSPVSANGMAFGEFGIYVDLPNGELACDDLVQVSLDENCVASVLPDMILEDDYSQGCSPGDFIVEVRDWKTNQLIDIDPMTAWPQLGVDQVGKNFMVTILDPATGNSCWGSISVEDKFAPVLSCPSDITLNFGCLAQTLPIFTGTPLVRENCSTFTLVYKDRSTLGSCNLGYSEIIEREWIASDQFGNKSSCTQRIFVGLGNVGDIAIPLNFDGLELNPQPLNCDEGLHNNFNFSSHLLDYPLCVDGYLLDSAVWVGTGGIPGNDLSGQRQPRVLGWNIIGFGSFAGHPSPDDVYYPVHPDAECWSTANTWVMWRGTGKPNIGSCRNINISFSDTEIPLSTTNCTAEEPPCYKIIREWIMVDWCSSTIRRENQLIKVMDTKGPSILYPSSITVSTDIWECKGKIKLPEPWLADNCSKELHYTVELESGDIIGSDSAGYILFNLPFGFQTAYIVAEDCCGNISRKEFLLDVVDDVPPVAVCEKRTTVSLTNAIVPGTNYVKINVSSFDDGSFDNCSPHVYFKAIRMDELLGTNNGSSDDNLLNCDGVNGDDDLTEKGNQIYFDDYVKFCCDDVGKTIMVVFRVFDVSTLSGPVKPSDMEQGGYLFGHFSDCMIEVEVQNKAVPTIVPPADVVVSCEFWFDLKELENPNNTTFGKIVTDLSKRTKLSTKDIVCSNFCVENPYTGYPGYISGIPPHLNPASNIACEAYNNLYDVNHPDNKYDIVWGYDGYSIAACEIMPSIEVEDRRQCGEGKVLRHFLVRGPNNILIKSTQTIWVVNCDPFFVNGNDYCDTEDDLIWDCDLNEVILQGCGANLSPDNPVLGRPSVDPRSHSACALISIDYSDEKFDIAENACFKILRTWKIVDWCQYDPLVDTEKGRWEIVQVIKVRDTISPDGHVVLGDCEPAFKQNGRSTCSGHLTINVDASDTCTVTGDIFYEYKLDLYNDGIFEYGVGTLSRNQYNRGYHANHSNNPYADDADKAFDASGTYPIGKHRIQFFLEDGCGNIRKIDTVFQVKDCKAPTPYCLNGIITVPMPTTGCVDIWAKDLDRGSYDNCTPNENLRFYFNGDTLKPFIRLCCEDFIKAKAANNIYVDVEVYVMDLEGNSDFCKTVINVQDNNDICPDPTSNNVVITGFTKTQSDASIHPVQLELYENSNLLQSIINKKQGDYAFTALNYSDNYYVKANKNDDPLNGVTTADIVKIQKHILGKESLNSPYLLIAADVNNTKTITASDLSEIRKLILGAIPQFQKSPSWKFMPEKTDFPDPTNPYDFVSEQKVNLINFQGDAKFRGIKMGDLNYSALPNGFTNAYSRSIVGLKMGIENVSLASGSAHQIPVYAVGNATLNSVQFTLEWDNQVIDVKSFIGEKFELQEQNINLEFHSSGLATMSWNSVEPLKLKSGDILFYIDMQSKISGDLISAGLNASDKITLRETSDENNEIGSVQINYLFDNQDGKNIDFSLKQNIPNPFDQSTQIEFIISIETTALLEVYNSTGQIVFRKPIEAVKGSNIVNLDKDLFASVGLYYYRLQVGEKSKSRSMIYSPAK
ncbi:MAG: T9SS type A sorting domain-containing protein [Saprospiraceae bacterium]|nr:T9SS type A sorting domain-containing protein [Saprospiraceae bacterium]MBK7797434.1 T9SS type A sorting domain-containing protein [Saprospiraceae bacterium]MBL0261454.1 T9SS type A sorting domain-containing protein [Saprospiraceae bacterium]